MPQEQAYTLSQLSRRLTGVIAADPYLQNVWVTAETVDVRVSGGHCYLELLEKEEGTGRALARARATIWASTFRMLSAKFYAETGQQFRSDLKVMVCVCASYHPVYGLSLNITSINAAYTLGDAMRRRAQMVERLKTEGIIDMNRSLQWPAIPQRIAIISARGAAGYGDFINQLYNNPFRIKFQARLFPAILQGDKAPASIIGALNDIADQAHLWDCVVIIRGGGATSDLAAYDDYDLAANIAQFPLPIVIGIGHERDITLLDYVANMRVKTPTAAAEWLVQRGEEALAALHAIAQAMLQAVTDRMAGCHRQLSYIAGQLPAQATTALMRAARRLDSAQASLASVADRKLTPAAARISAMSQSIAQATAFAMAKARQRLDSMQQLIGALSPEATLRRGYAIVRMGGHAISSVKGVSAGQEIEISVADGQISSTILKTTSKE